VVHSAHSARVHGTLTAPTHHTPAPSSSLQVNGYTPLADAVRVVDPRYQPRLKRRPVRVGGATGRPWGPTSHRERAGMHRVRVVDCTHIGSSAHGGMMYPYRGSHHFYLFIHNSCPRVVFCTYVHEASAGSYALAMYPASFGAVILQCQSVCPF
jgi:hypothetical protein